MEEAQKELIKLEEERAKLFDELNVIVDSGNSNLMKATLQRIETNRAINGVCGTKSNRVVDMKNLVIGILKSFKTNPQKTWQTIKPIIKWIKQNDDQAMQTFFQMLITHKVL
ncbi:hypothetical protein IJG72_04230 [bacterium]|nr:hypothetical protein [bacterium]